MHNYVLFLHNQLFCKMKFISVTYQAVLILVSFFWINQTPGQEKAISFGGSFPVEMSPAKNVSDQSPAIKQEILNNIHLLGLKARNKQSGEIQSDQFIVPIASSNSQDPGYYTITAYFDHDEFIGEVEDYNCGELSYDLDNGYNHTGTDFFLWPFPWLKMDSNSTIVVATAGGTIVYKQDGNFDQNCEENELPANSISVFHSSGHISFYTHLKENSLTQKEVGDTVMQGEFLGFPGSSGSSLAPHLHFEVLDVGMNATDPFFGDCNSQITESMWADQLPYKKKWINKISTNHALPEFPDCPENEIPNEQSVFNHTDTVYLLSYLTNFEEGDQLQVNIYEPSGELWSTWSWDYDQPFYAASWNYFFIILTNEPEGEWTYELIHADQEVETTFQLIHESGLYPSDKKNVRLYPNPCNGELFIDRPDINIKSIEVFNLYGRKIKEYRINKTAKKIRMDIDASTGVYLLKINTIAGQIQKKIAVIK